MHPSLLIDLLHTRLISFNSGIVSQTTGMAVIISMYNFPS